VLARLGDVVGGLHVQQQIHGRPESLLDASAISGVSLARPFSTADSAALVTSRTRAPSVHVQALGLDDLDQVSWLGRVLHRHRYFSSYCRASVGCMAKNYHLPFSLGPGPDHSGDPELRAAVADGVALLEEIDLLHHAELVDSRLSTASIAGARTILRCGRCAG
jgi:hypothetical protein